MIACYYQINTFNQQYQEKFRYINNIKIGTPMNGDVLMTILPEILVEFCGATAVGYNRSTNVYWCKMMHCEICLLHIDLHISQTNSRTTDIIITPSIGADQTIAHFVSNLKESIELYNTSAFFRKTLGIGL